MRRLIINADDLGLTRGVNRAIVEAHTKGVVTSATMMANAPATAEAAEVVSHLKRLSVGCHVVLIDGRPVLPAKDVPTLLAPHARAAVFRRSWLQFATAAVRGQMRAEEIGAEVQAQIATLGALGIPVSHVDTHKHTHLFPAILRALLRGARNCGIRTIRNPLTPLRPLAFSHLVRRPRLWKRYSQVRVLRRMAEGYRRTVEDEGMRTTDGTFGIVVTGALDEQLFRALAGSIPEGTWELVCHPGYCDDDLNAAGTRLRESRAAELAVLTSTAAREALQQHGVELISYWQL